MPLIVLTLVLIVVSTLYPFKFSLPGVSPLRVILHAFRTRSSVLDVFANVILFMPLGFGLASIIAKRHYTFFTKLLAVSLLCGGLSCSIELLQVFLPGRRPTAIDVLTNGAGGGLGFLCFHYLGSILFTLGTSVARLIQKGLAKLSLKQLVGGLIAYTLLAGALVVFWQSASLRGWEPNLPLSIGHNAPLSQGQQEQAIDYSWEGTVADLILSDRDLSRDQVKTFFSDPQAFLQTNSSVLAAYSLRGANGTQDLMGQAPALIQQGTSSLSFSKNGLHLLANQGLQTAQPITAIINRIRDASSFTISALVTPANTPNTSPYPRPIITIAPPIGNGNLAISQLQSNLQIILTYSRTTRGQRFYRQVLPDIFTDKQPHRLLLTYSGFVLRTYVDGVERVYITDIAPNQFKTVFYLLILLPLGLLITLVANRLKQRVWIYLMLVGGGTLLPALLLEGFWVMVGDRNIRLSNLLLGILIVGGTIIAAQGKSLRSLKLMKARPS